MKVALGTVTVDDDDRRLIAACLGYHPENGHLASRDEVRLFHRRIAPDQVLRDRAEQLDLEREQS